jgi:hypothetical protein
MECCDFCGERICNTYVIDIIRKHFIRQQLQKIEIFLATTDDKNGNEED